MSCTRGQDVGSSTAVTVVWTGVAAEKYVLTVSPSSGMTPNPAEVPQTGVGHAVSTTLTFKWPNASGKGVYNLSLATKSADKTGTPILLDVDLLGKNQTRVTCTPGK